VVCTLSFMGLFLDELSVYFVRANAYLTAYRSTCQQIQCAINVDLTPFIRLMRADQTHGQNTM
jgi:hypothetical protein